MNEALLLNKNLAFSKHSAVIASFGKEFVKKGFFSQRFPSADFIRNLRIQEPKSNKIGLGAGLYYIFCAFSAKYSKEQHKSILEAFEVRNTGDYGPINSVKSQKAKDLLSKAKELIGKVESYLSPSNYRPE